MVALKIGLRTQGKRINPFRFIEALQGARQEREETFEEDEIRAVWLRVTGTDADTYLRAAKLVMLTGQREGEITMAEWGHVRQRVWTIPAKNTKAKRQQRVLLSNQAMEVLERQKGKDPRWIFPAVKTVTGHIRVDTLSKKIKSLIRDAECRDQLVPHCLRSAMNSWVSENALELCLGDPRKLRYRMLNHKPTDKLESTYDKDQANKPAKKAWQAWADHLDSLVETRGDNVVSMGG